MNERVAVDLGGRGEEKTGVLGFRETERLVRPERPDLERLNGELEVVDGTRGAREVKDVVEGPVDPDLLGDVVLHELEPRVADVLEVRAVAGDEVVHPDDLVTPGEQMVHEMRADETRSAGDESSGHVQYACL